MNVAAVVSAVLLAFILTMFALLVRRGWKVLTHDVHWRHVVNFFSLLGILTFAVLYSRGQL